MLDKVLKKIAIALKNLASPSLTARLQRISTIYQNGNYLEPGVAGFFTAYGLHSIFGKMPNKEILDPLILVLIILVSFWFGKRRARFEFSNSSLMEFKILWDLVLKDVSNANGLGFFKLISPFLKRFVALPLPAKLRLIVSVYFLGEESSEFIITGLFATYVLCSHFGAVPHKEILDPLVLGLAILTSFWFGKRSMRFHLNPKSKTMGKISSQKEQKPKK